MIVALTMLSFSISDLLITDLLMYESNVVLLSIVSVSASVLFSVEFVEFVYAWLSPSR